MTKFVIEGTGDEARAVLKASLDAQNAAFKAGLDAMFKFPPPANVTEVPAAKLSAAPGWVLETDRNRQHKR